MRHCGTKHLSYAALPVYLAQKAQCLSQFRGWLSRIESRREGLLAHFFAVGIRHYRYMHIARLRQTRQPLQINLACRGSRVIDNHGKLVSEDTVRAKDDEVSGLA